MNITQLIEYGEKGNHILYVKSLNFSYGNSPLWFSGIIVDKDIDETTLYMESSDSRIKEPSSFKKNHGGQFYIVSPDFLKGGIEENYIDHFVAETSPSHLTSMLVAQIKKSRPDIIRSYTTEFLSESLQQLLQSKQKDNEVTDFLTMDIFDTIDEFPYLSPKRIEELRKRIQTG